MNNMFNAISYYRMNQVLLFCSSQLHPVHSILLTQIDHIKYINEYNQTKWISFYWYSCHINMIFYCSYFMSIKLKRKKNIFFILWNRIVICFKQHNYSSKIKSKISNQICSDPKACVHQCSNQKFSSQNFYVFLQKSLYKTFTTCKSLWSLSSKWNILIKPNLIINWLNI